MEQTNAAALQEQMIQTWADILGIEPGQIGVDDGFFDIGGDSVGASLVVRKLKNCNVKVDLLDIFEYKTVAAICGAIRARQAAAPAHSST